jgi:hypothetical protein
MRKCLPLLILPVIVALAGCATPANQRKLYESDSINTLFKSQRTIVYEKEYTPPTVSAAGAQVIPVAPAPDSGLPPVSPLPDPVVPADAPVEAAPPAM